MPAAQLLIWGQLRKSPSWARMAEAMARSGKLRCFVTSLPVKTWWSRALVAWRFLVTSTGLPAALAGSPIGPLENHSVELLDRAHLLRGEHRDRAAALSQHVRDRITATGPARTVPVHTKPGGCTE
jgi:hypothetical protein